MNRKFSFYVFAGRTLIVLIIVVVWLIIKPKQGIPSEMTNPENIDSIRIDFNENTLVVTEKKDFADICRQFSKLVPANPDRIKIHTQIIYLNIYGKQQEIPIRIIYAYYDGIVMEINNQYYKNDSLNILTRQWLDIH